MIKKIQKKIQKNSEIFALSLLMIITVISTTYYNYDKKKIYSNYKNIINNVYLKKTVNHLFDSLEPKFKKVERKVSQGETLSSILEEYSISKKEISDINEKISKKINLSKLNAGQKIQFTIDQSSNLFKEFIFQVSNTEKIYLTRDTKTDKFNQSILVTKLNKKILYKENIIMQSLYKSAINQNILRVLTYLLLIKIRLNKLQIKKMMELKIINLT